MNLIEAIRASMAQKLRFQSPRHPFQYEVLPRLDNGKLYIQIWFDGDQLVCIGDLWPLEDLLANDWDVSEAAKPKARVPKNQNRRYDIRSNAVPVDEPHSASPANVGAECSGPHVWIDNGREAPMACLFCAAQKPRRRK